LQFGYYQLILAAWENEYEWRIERVKIKGIEIDEKGNANTGGKNFTAHKAAHRQPELPWLRWVINPAVE